MNAGMVLYMKIHQCSRLHKQTQNKNHMVISLDAERALDNIQNSFMIKVLERSKIQDHT